MVPVVNKKYRYILLYSAKAACTSLRTLYLDVHRDELTEKQLAQLDWYHNLNEVQAYDPGADYSDYFTYVITRNPYSRIVSAYLDQYVYACNEGMRQMLAECPPAAGKPSTFIEFLEYLKTVPDELRDSHVQSQAYFAYAESVVTPANFFYRLFRKKPQNAFGVRYCGDISGFNKHTQYVFKRVFRRDPAKLRFALEKLGEVSKHNSSFYGKTDFEDAACLDASTLNQLVFAPKPQDFFNKTRARELVDEIYQQDFELFGYRKGDIPQKGASSEVDAVPQDLDWEMYIRLNPDLPRDQIYNERTVVRHYLEFGRFEEHLRAYKIEAPAGFDWQRYLLLHADLQAAGITTEHAAIEHYISYGIREEREI